MRHALPSVVREPSSVAARPVLPCVAVSSLRSSARRPPPPRPARPAPFPSGIRPAPSTSVTFFRRNSSNPPLCPASAAVPDALPLPVQTGRRPPHPPSALSLRPAPSPSASGPAPECSASGLAPSFPTACFFQIDIEARPPRPAPSPSGLHIRPPASTLPLRVRPGSRLLRVRPGSLLSCSRVGFVHSQRLRIRPSPSPFGRHPPPPRPGRRPPVPRPAELDFFVRGLCFKIRPSIFLWPFGRQRIMYRFCTQLLPNLPKSLPCRDREMEEISAFVKDAICNDHCLGRCLYIHGVPGTGETTMSALAVMRRLRSELDSGALWPYCFIEINGLKLAPPENIYKVYKLLLSLTNDRSALLKHSRCIPSKRNYNVYMFFKYASYM